MNIRIGTAGSSGMIEVNIKSVKSTKIVLLVLSMQLVEMEDLNAMKGMSKEERNVLMTLILSCQLMKY